MAASKAAVLAASAVAYGAEMAYGYLWREKLQKFKGELVKGLWGY